MGQDHVNVGETDIETDTHRSLVAVLQSRQKQFEICSMVGESKVYDVKLRTEDPLSDSIMAEVL